MNMQIRAEDSAGYLWVHRHLLARIVRKYEGRYTVVVSDLTDAEGQELREQGFSVTPEVQFDLEEEG